LLAEMEASGYAVRDSIDCPSDADRFIVLGAEKELPPAGRRSYSLADLVPLMAFGPGSRHFSGIRRNEEIGSLLFTLVDAQR
jgi:hypothetical protein